MGAFSEGESSRGVGNVRGDGIGGKVRGREMFSVGEVVIEDVEGKGIGKGLGEVEDEK